MAVETKDHVFTLLQNHQGHIKQLGVKRLGLFGSFVRRQQNTESDVDVLVEFEPGCKTFDAFMQLSNFLEDLFERRVELVTPESLSPYISPYILKEIEYVEFDTSLLTPHLK
ncbi:MAG: nucleotidyltransferase [Candidatus Entotheonella factor]|uniref:Nucleotidyltransferase n=1 Tax=Entotheonella factor TaxID=1429438 RepID=W4LEV1_ENTF1|nr:nucleotidyltransferase family protein [Candidatus Entotheonella palauensis]ETW96230.1 MAG: nucleotidyltransferase [Candidatus Entotheonella factor]